MTIVQVDGYTYNPDEPINDQVYAYDCSADATAWFGRSIGWSWSDLNVWGEFVKTGTATARDGLLDHTGAGIVRWLAMQPLPAANGQLFWHELLNLAGTRPILIGGDRWNHWTGVRSSPDGSVLALANPAPGWMGVFQLLDETDYANLGPFWTVWLSP